MVPKRTPTLAQLKEQQAELAVQIREAKKRERLQAIETERQRYSIIGRALAKELATNHELAAKMEPIINARVTNPKERALLGLPPQAKTEAPSAGQ